MLEMNKMPPRSICKSDVSLICLTGDWSEPDILGNVKQLVESIENVSFFFESIF